MSVYVLEGIPAEILVCDTTFLRYIVLTWQNVFAGSLSIFWTAGKGIPAEIRPYFGIENYVIWRGLSLRR
jgi:hypothetical protein